MNIHPDLLFVVGFLIGTVFIVLFAAWRFAATDLMEARGLLANCQAERDNLDTEAEEATDQIEELTETLVEAGKKNCQQFEMLTRRAETITQLARERDLFRRQAEAAQAKLAAIIDTACGNYKGDAA